MELLLVACAVAAVFAAATGIVAGEDRRRARRHAEQRRARLASLGEPEPLSNPHRSAGAGFWG